MVLYLIQSRNEIGKTFDRISGRTFTTLGPWRTVDKLESIDEAKSRITKYRSLSVGKRFRIMHGGKLVK